MLQYYIFLFLQLRAQDFQEGHKSQITRNAKTMQIVTCLWDIYLCLVRLFRLSNTTQFDPTLFWVQLKADEILSYTKIK